MFPVLGRVNLKASKAVLVHLYLGPLFGFRTGFESKETLTVGGVTTTTTDNNDEGIKENNIDLAFGGQVDFGRFLVDLRYSLGLTNLNQDTGPEEPEVKNRTLSMMFGVQIEVVASTQWSRRGNESTSDCFYGISRPVGRGTRSSLGVRPEFSGWRQGRYQCRQHQLE